MLRRDALSNILALSGAIIFNSGFLKDSKMNTRKIPVSNEELPVIGVGTWQTFDVGSTPGEREPLEQVLKLLFEKGGSVIDSSPMYGRSEQVVGEILQKSELHKHPFLATKVWTNGKEEGIRQMNRSFELMKTEKMDLMQIHNLVDWKTHLATLRKWKEEGKVRYLGITHYHEGAFDQVEKVMKSEQLDFVQINYSLRSRSAENRILPLAAEKGIAVLINQPFESGSLFTVVKNKKLPVWARDFDCESWAQYFLKFILSNKHVTCVIPGTAKPKHLLDNTLAGFGKLPDETTRKKMVEYLSS
jgi:diketogulonate reductase-like aldo/keto reductase